MLSLLTGSQAETCMSPAQSTCVFTLLPLHFWKRQSKKIFSNSTLGLRSSERYYSALFIYILWFMNVCRHACLCVCVWARMCACGWMICNCVCMCVKPQRYFDFFRILNKHAAAASVKRCLPVAYGLDGWWYWWWSGRRGLYPWLWGGWGSSWSGPPPDTLAPRAGGLLNHHTPPPKPCQPRLPANPLPTQITHFSFCIWRSLSLSPCVSVLLSLSSPPFLPDTFSFLSFLIQLIQIHIHSLFGCLLISHLPLCF